ncbi:MAG: amidohydrolase [Rhodocyclaceae bacterium]|nr:MAG: amidohydrolase [Rhodocyclaceae bacterium]
MSRNRIDVHQHIIPPFWADWLKAKGGDPSGWAAPAWSADAAIAMMDKEEIRAGMLSVTAPGVSVGQGPEIVDMAKRINDWNAGFVSQRPDRFGLFVTLPMPDVEATLLEVERAFDELGADGVTLFTNYGGRYLGDPIFLPVLEELDRRHAFVFVHPSKPDASMVNGVPSPVIDYPFDTTRTATSLLFAGVMHRLTNIKISLSHAGGMLPFVAHRIAELAPAANISEMTREELLQGIRGFYFDTALSSSRQAIDSLVAVANPERIMFGSDFPYAPLRTVSYFTQALDDNLKDQDSLLTKINSGNALKLFSRLSS